MPLTKDKKRLNKLIQSSDSEDSEHELSHYVNDRVKLMKQVLKTLKPKKIKAMAPTCLKNMEMEEINSMLLEELLGISNKRLKHIFQGKTLNDDSSSTTSEENIDVISLDDVSDDDLEIIADVDRPKHKKVKKERYDRIVKKEKISKKTNSDVCNRENLMNVLELLELQARARAIKSQLLVENSKTQPNIPAPKNATIVEEKVGSDDDIIIETVKGEEIVIESSDSDNEAHSKLPGESKEDAVVAEIIESITSVDKSRVASSKIIEMEKEEKVSEVNSESTEKNISESTEENISERTETNTSGHDTTLPENEGIANCVDMNFGNRKIVILENKQILDQTEKVDDKSKEDDEIIIINISDDEMEKIK